MIGFSQFEADGRDAVHAAPAQWVKQGERHSNG
jgi:hypothetical protein